MHRRRLFRTLIVTVLGTLLAAAGAPAPAGAKPKPKPKSTPAKTTHGSSAAAAKAATASAAAKDPPPLPPPQGKVVVFAFTGDGAQHVQRQVVSALRAKGMKVVTDLRPVDSPEQFREMAVTLNLVAYVDGEYASDGDHASATVHLRSGVTGLRAMSTTFAGERRTLPGEVGKTMWERINPDLAKLCVEAAKPRKAERAPLRIEAGTPLESRPADTSSAAR